MEVYVLVCNSVNVDGGDFTTEVVGVYQEFAQALKVMKQYMKHIREEFEDYDFEEEKYVDGDMSWSIWEKEQYASNHCDLIIEYRTVH